jgi:hypothetical protein
VQTADPRVDRVQIHEVAPRLADRVLGHEGELVHHSEHLTTRRLRQQADRISVDSDSTNRGSIPSEPSTSAIATGNRATTPVAGPNGISTGTKVWR